MSVLLSLAPRPLRRLVAVLLLLLAGLGVVTAPATADVRPDRLTSAQEREVLRLIDDVCADTWCEGDHAFRFDRFSCRTKRSACVLVAQIAPRSEEPLCWQRRAQPVRGFSRYTDLVTTSPDGWTSLQPGFHHAVAQAVTAMQATVRLAAARAGDTTPCMPSRRERPREPAAPSSAAALGSPGP